jgi:hypothetical protein
METQITLSLPQTLLEQARWLGSATQRDTAEVLTDALEMMWPTLTDQPMPISPPVPTLPDAEVLALVSLKMDEAQNSRLGALQAKGKESFLTEAERYELMTLLQIYQIGQLRKSEALAEAQQRHLL